MERQDTMQINELTNLILELLESKRIDALVDKHPDLKIAVDAGIKNVQYLNWIIKNGGGEPIQDIVGVVKVFDANRRRLKDMGKSSDIYSYESPGDIRRAFEELDTSEVDDEVKASETDTLGTFGDWTVVMPHSIQSSCAWGAGTTWCTAATKTQNMFLSYVGRKNEDIILYYLIQSGQSTRINPNSKISVGFINGNPVLKGEDGGVTVNADNEGLTDADLREILGSDYQSIMDAMIKHAQEIKGTHPAKKQMERAAKDVGFFKSIIKKMKSDTLFDFFNQLKEYNPSEEVMAFEPEILRIASTSPTEVVRQMVADNPSTPPEALVKLAGDSNFFVRTGVANNPSAPPEALVKLAGRKRFRNVVANNPSYQAIQQKGELNEMLRWKKLAGIRRS
jgi:hypothetical protein